jgi:6-pyruvoyltetrahydropterin/6-carboxytetrahydropterin synthase
LPKAETKTGKVNGRLTLYTACIERHFPAAHQLRFPDGSKEDLHEHDWIVTACVSSEKLDELGTVMDFIQLGEMLEKILGEMADKNLESVEYFQQHNPSAEILARYIFEKLQPQLPSGVQLKHIKVVEAPGCWAIYSQ